MNSSTRRKRSAFLGVLTISLGLLTVVGCTSGIDSLKGGIYLERQDVDWTMLDTTDESCAGIRAGAALAHATVVVSDDNGAEVARLKLGDLTAPDSTDRRCGADFEIDLPGSSGFYGFKIESVGETKVDAQALREATDPEMDGGIVLLVSDCTDESCAVELAR
jgi:hypothetical protein